MKWIATSFLLLSLTSSVYAPSVEISGTSATLGASNHVLTCTLMGPGPTDLEYQWSIGERVLQSFSDDNLYILGTVFVLDAQNYTCEVRETETLTPLYSETAGLHVTIMSFVMTFNCEDSANPPIPYVGSNLTYCCRSLLTSNLRATYANLMGSAEITGPSGTPIDNTEGRVRLSEVMQIEHNFEQILFLSPLSDVDKGRYTCTGTIQPETPNVLVTNGVGSTTHQDVLFPDLRLEVELPSVTGCYSDIDTLSLTCSATVMVRNDPAPLNMEFTWLRSVDSRPQEELTSDLYTNSRVFGYNETSTLTVFLERPGNYMYTCLVNLNVRPAPDIMMEEQSVSLEVIGLQFEVELAHVSGRYLVIEPYNSLSLMCSTIVMLLDNPAPFSLNFTWTRTVNSGAQEKLTSDLYTNSMVFGSAATSVLTVRTEEPGNHVYTCRVTLNTTVPRANMSERRVEVVGPAEPRVPGIIFARILPDSVTVQWQVTSLSYDPESYRVLYGRSGEELNLTSRLVTSGDDIAVTDLTLSVSLMGLGIGTYNYVLEVTNSVGVRQSQLRSFTITETSLSPGAVAGIVLAAVAAVLFVIIALIVVLVLFRRSSSKKSIGTERMYRWGDSAHYSADRKFLELQLSQSAPPSFNQGPVVVKSAPPLHGDPDKNLDTPPAKDSPRSNQEPHPPHMHQPLNNVADGPSLDQQAALQEAIRKKDEEISRIKVEKEGLQHKKTKAEEIATQKREAYDKACEVTIQARKEFESAHEKANNARSVITSM